MKRKSHRIPGQGKQEDSSLKDFFRDNDRFAGLFNHMLSKEDRIDPNDLIELDTDEVSLIDVGSHGRIILQQFRDVVKGVLGEMDGIVPFGMKLAGMNALLAVTGSQELRQIEQENTNPSTGGINMCAGIQMMIDKGRRKGERRGERKGERRGQIIGAIQAWAEIGLKKDEILTRIIMKYHLKEPEASNYYDKAISSPSSSGVKVNCKIQ